jgi:hypothetical protein
VMRILPSALSVFAFAKGRGVRPQHGDRMMVHIATFFQIRHARWQPELWRDHR